MLTVGSNTYLVSYEGGDGNAGTWSATRRFEVKR